MFEKKSKEFLRKNSRTIEIAKQIDDYLKNTGRFYITPIVNLHTIFLKIPDKNNYQLNSNLIIDEQGYGKTTFIKMIKKSIPKLVNMLPRKMYAVELTEKGNEYFNNKILLHGDLITAFEGLNQKTLKQLTSFWTEILSDHYYSQLGRKLKDVSCLTIFGMARISYNKSKEKLFESTFFERIVPIFNTKRTDKEIKEILSKRREIIKKGTKIPKLKLNIKKPNSQNIKMTEEVSITNEVDDLSIQLEKYNNLSSTRAYNYIEQFLKANALLNDRKIVEYEDLEMYKDIHNFHILETTLKFDFYKRIILNNEKLSDLQIIEKYKLRRNTYYKFKKILTENGELHKV